jgi:hypothetical protein
MQLPFKQLSSKENKQTLSKTSQHH